MIVLCSPILAFAELFYWKIILKFVLTSTNLYRLFLYAVLGIGGFLSALIDATPPVFRFSRFLVFFLFSGLLEFIRQDYRKHQNLGQ